MSQFELSVPGNLLLAGEYAITRPGGIGLAMGVGPRATATVKSEPRRAERPTLRVEANMGSTRLVWPESELAIVPAVLDSLKTDGIKLPGHLSVTAVVDTGPFFRGGVGKLGLGSSAASAVLIAASLLTAIGMDPGSDPTRVARIAHNAHRSAKGGRGSGYDVYASTYGGTGVFHASGDPRHNPRWETIPTPLLTELNAYGWINRSPVDTGEAIDRFNQACSVDDRWAHLIVADYNKLVGTMVTALGGTSAEPFFRSVDESRKLGIAIGDRIGVPARIEVLERARGKDHNWTFKSTGAGNERALVFALAEPDVSGLEPVAIEHAGLRCMVVPDAGTGTHPGAESDHRAARRGTRVLGAGPGRQPRTDRRHRTS